MLVLILTTQRPPVSLPCDGNGLVAVGLALDSGRDQVAQLAAAQEG